MTYPLDTAGVGLPVLEFRLKAPILCREEERERVTSHRFPETRVLGNWILGDRFLVWIKHQNGTKSHRSGEGEVFFPNAVVKSWAALAQGFSEWGPRWQRHPLGTC